MAQDTGQGFGIHTAGEGVGGEGVTQIMETDAGESCPLEQRFHVAISRVGVDGIFRLHRIREYPLADGIRLAPPHDHLGEKIGAILPAGCENAKVLRGLMEAANRILEHHPLNEKLRAEGKMPANGVWFWAEGTAVKLPDFKAETGHDGVVVSAVPLCHGIAALTGLSFVCPEGATGEKDTNYENKLAAALEILEAHDFAAVHVEAPDECTHNGDLEGKLEAIGWLDTRLIRPLDAAMRSRGWDYRLLFLSDHKTLTSTRGHDGDPVPYMLYDSRVDTKAGLPYTEKSGEKGPYVDAGIALMSILFEK